jgi:Zn ribbon nucleic-acid-binding protein
MENKRYTLSCYKNEIYNHLSGMECPVCDNAFDKLCVGAVSEFEQTPALFCVRCGFRMAVVLTLTSGKEIGTNGIGAAFGEVKG